LISPTVLVTWRSSFPARQQYWVAVTRALVANPKLILADKPKGNLDSVNGEVVKSHDT
jgi:ABC-type lipoprotein export system ATPase subunit